MKDSTLATFITVKEKAVQMKQTATQKITSFWKEEKSAKVFAEEGWMIYAVIIIGIAMLLIAIVFMDEAFNSIGNFFNDGVTGQTDENGLNQWKDQTDGFNRE